MAWLRSLKEEDQKLIDMKKDEFDKFMCEKFSDIFCDRNKPMTETCMCWGFEIGPGWRPWLFEACEKITYLQGVSHVLLIADQVKEKYGGLRFYFHIDLKLKGATSQDEHEDKIVELLMEDVVSLAEDKCSSYCETCGQRGTSTIGGGWMVTLCDDCACKKGRMTVSLRRKEEAKKEKAKDKNKAKEGNGQAGNN